MIKRFFYVLFFILVFISTPAFATNHWVTPSGAGGHNGSSSGDAWSQSEFEALSGTSYAGDTFYFSGTYTTSLDVSISGTVGNHVTLDGYETDNTTCRTDGTPELSNGTTRARVGVSSDDAIRSDGQSYVIIQDFEVSSTGTTSSDEAIQMGNINTSQSSYQIARRNFVHDCQEGIYVSGSYFTVGGASGDGNTVKDVGTTTADASILTATAQHVTISWNHIYNADPTNRGIDGITLAGGSGDDYVLIEHNHIHGFDRSNAEDGIDCKYTAHHIIIRYNYIHGMNGSGEGINLSNGDHSYVYIYGNYLKDNHGNFYTKNRSGTSPDYVYHDFHDIYFFSNVVDSAVDVYGMLLSGNASNGYSLAYKIYNNTVVANPTTGSPSSSAYTGIYDSVSSGQDVYIKNNVFVNNRSGVTDYVQLYFSTIADNDADLDYNWYYWNVGGVQSSKVYWDGGNRTIDTLQSTYNQEQGILNNEGDPGFENLSGGDYRPTTSSNLLNAGTDMRSVNITTISINGTSYTVRGDEALGLTTSFSGNDPSGWTIEEVLRDSIGKWDIGAYQTSGPILSGGYPTSLQPCDGTESTDTIGVTSSENADCKYSVSGGSDDCNTAYADLDVQFTTGEGTTSHSFTHAQYCGGSTTFYVRCLGDVTSLESNCLEITHEVVPAGGTSPQPTPVSIPSGFMLMTKKSLITKRRGTSHVDYTADANCMGAWFLNGTTTETDRSGEGGTLSVSAGDTISRSTDVPSAYGGYSRGSTFADQESLYHANNLSTDITGDTDLTIVGWMKLGTDNRCYITTKYDPASTQRQYELVYRQEDNAMAGYISDDGSTYAKAIGGTGYSTLGGSWHHVAMTYDDSATEITIFIDAAIDSSANNPKDTSGTATSIYASSAPFGLFGRPDTPAESSTCELDEVAVFNRELSLSEIQEIMDYGLDGTRGAND